MPVWCKCKGKPLINQISKSDNRSRPAYQIRGWRGKKRRRHFSKPIHPLAGDARGGTQEGKTPMIDTLPACAISAPESDHCSHTEGRAGGGLSPCSRLGNPQCLTRLGYPWLPLAMIRVAFWCLCAWRHRVGHGRHGRNGRESQVLAINNGIVRILQDTRDFHEALEG